MQQQKIHRLQYNVLFNSYILSRMYQEFSAGCMEEKDFKWWKEGGG